MLQTLDAETQALRQILHAEETRGRRTGESHSQYPAPAATELVASPRLGGRRCAGIGSLVFFKIRRTSEFKSLQFIRTVDRDFFLSLTPDIEAIRDFETHPG